MSRTPSAEAAVATLVPERVDARTVAAHIHALASAAIAEVGCFVVVLPGGTTPDPVLRAVEALGSGARWERWTVILSDERCLPTGHPDRNDVALRRCLPSLARAGRLVTPTVEQGADAAAASWSAAVAAAGAIDLALLGLGADGHTAGIFEHPPVHRTVAPAADAAAACLVVRDAPAPFPERITLHPRTLAAARQLWFLVDGGDAGKRRAVDDLCRGEGIAAAVVTGAPTRLLVLGADGGGR